MRWEKLLFLHWRWSPDDLKRRLPTELSVDTFDGSAWLGIVPFLMREVRPFFLPPVGALSNFLELNVRTYVTDREGNPGVWFFSLACDQPVAVELARATFGLNYVHARMRCEAEPGGALHYTSSRRGSLDASFDYVPVGRGQPAEPGTLEFFLIERYLLFARRGGRRLLCGRVHHAPYRWAVPSRYEGGFEAALADGFEDPGRPADHVVGVEDVHVHAWPPRRCG